MTWQPGVSGNPEGRRKEKPYAEALRLEIKATADADNPLKALRAVARAHLKKAANGDVAAIAELANRLDGKVPQAVVGDEDNPSIFAGLSWLAWLRAPGIEVAARALDTSSISQLPNDINGLAAIEDKSNPVTATGAEEKCSGSSGLAPGGT